ncbi:rCG21232, partial [Rattus norvegicus]
MAFKDRTRVLRLFAAIALANQLPSWACDRSLCQRPDTCELEISYLHNNWGVGVGG